MRIVDSQTDIQSCEENQEGQSNVIFNCAASPPVETVTRLKKFPVDSIMAAFNGTKSCKVWKTTNILLDPVSNTIGSG